MNISEGKLTQTVENQTARVPSLGYLGAAVGTMVASAAIAYFSPRRRELANFVGLWAPSLLILGLYNKLVKVERDLQAQHERQATLPIDRVPSPSTASINDPYSSRFPLREASH